jgi:hypothetical protein
MSEGSVREPQSGEGLGVRGSADTFPVRRSSEDSPTVWVIGSDSVNYQQLFGAYGNPVLIAAWYDHARSPAAIVERLLFSKETDRLAIGYHAQPAHIVFAVAIWFMLHTQCQLIFANNEGGLAAQRLDKVSMLKMVDLARREYEGKKKR